MTEREVDLGFWRIVETNIGHKLTAEEEAARLGQMSGHAARDARLISAASLYHLVQSQQLTISLESHEQAMNDLADMSEEYGLNSDQIHALLASQEASLGRLVCQPIIWPDTSSAAE